MNSTVDVVVVVVDELLIVVPSTVVVEDDVCVVSCITISQLMSSGVTVGIVVKSVD